MHLWMNFDIINEKFEMNGLNLKHEIRRVHVAHGCVDC